MYTVVLSYEVNASPPFYSHWRLGVEEKNAVVRRVHEIQRLHIINLCVIVLIEMVFEHALSG